MKTHKHFLKSLGIASLLLFFLAAVQSNAQARHVVDPWKPGQKEASKTKAVEKRTLPRMTPEGKAFLEEFSRRFGHPGHKKPFTQKELDEFLPISVKKSFSAYFKDKTKTEDDKTAGQTVAYNRTSDLTFQICGQHLDYPEEPFWIVFGDEMDLHFGERHGSVPASALPRDVFVRTHYSYFTEPSLLEDFVEDILDLREDDIEQTVESSNGGDCIYHEGSGDLTVPTRKIRLNVEMGDPVYVLSDENSWEVWRVYNQHIWYLVELDPDDEMPEFEPRPGDDNGLPGCNKAIFAWLGTDNLSTSLEEAPPGFHFMGTWCPSGI